MDGRKIPGNPLCKAMALIRTNKMHSPAEHRLIAHSIEAVGKGRTIGIQCRVIVHNMDSTDKLTAHHGHSGRHTDRAGGVVVLHHRTLTGQPFQIGCTNQIISAEAQFPGMLVGNVYKNILHKVNQFISRTRQQLTKCPGATSSCTWGCRHASVAWGHLAAKRQPGLGLMGEVSSPFRISRLVG